MWKITKSKGRPISHDFFEGGAGPQKVGKNGPYGRNPLTKTLFFIHYETKRGSLANLVGVTLHLYYRPVEETH